MLIQSPFLSRLSPAIQEAIPQVGDDTLNVPPVFSVAGLPPEASFRLVAGVTQVAETSFVVQSGANIANGVQVILTPVILSRGWWEIIIQGTYRSNYVVPSSAGEMRILMADAISNYEVETMFSQLSGSQRIDRHFQLLLAGNLQMNMIMEANGVGQEHTSRFSIIGNKLL